MVAESQRVWLPKAIVALVAWLEFCAQKELNFMETITAHLASSSSEDQQTYTKKQAKDKIKGLSQFTFGSGIYIPLEKLYRDGKKSFTKIPPQVDLEINAALETYEVKYAQMLGERLNQQATGDSELDQHPQANATDLERNLEGQTRLEDSVVQNNALRSFSTLADVQSHQRPEWQSASQTKTTLAHRSPLQDKGYARLRTTHDGNQSSENYRTTAQANGNRREPLVSTTLAHQREVSLRETEIAELRKFWQSELDILYARQTQKNDTIAGLEAEIQGLKEALNSQKAGDLARKQPGEEFESLLIQRIYKYDLRVRTQEQTLGFIKGQGECQSRDWSLAHRDIDRAMDDIGFELESVLLGHDKDTSLLASKPIRNTDLISLSQSYLSFIDIPSDGALSIENFVLTCEISQLIRILMVVALREWVFQTDFPNFDQNSPFLHCVRKRVMAFSDWHTLHNIEMASYQELIQGSTFEDGLSGPEGSIPRKAHHLADRLSKAIGELFIETEGNNLNSWGQSRSVCENRHAHIVEIFTIALKFKAETVVTDCRYKFVLYPVGTTSPGPQSDGITGSVQFWKYATIQVFQGEASMPVDQFTNALVNSENFIAKDEQAPWMRCTYSKALQLPKPSPLRVQDSQYRATWLANANANAHRPRTSLPTKAVIGLASNLTETSSRVTGVPITCEECDIVFTEAKNRNVHQKNKSCRICPECGEKSKSFLDFQLHKATSHSKRLKSTIPPEECTCIKCGKVLSSRESRTRHEVNNCGIRCPRPMDLERHRQREHAYHLGPSAHDPIASTSMLTKEKSVASSTIMISTREIRSISGANNTKESPRCGICNKEFKTNQGLGHHKKTCTRSRVNSVLPLALSPSSGLGEEASLFPNLDQNEHRCPVCSQDFNSLYGLEQHHQRTHNNRRPTKRQKIAHPGQQEAEPETQNTANSDNPIDITNEIFSNGSGLESLESENSDTITRNSIERAESVDKEDELSIGARLTTVEERHTVSDRLSTASRSRTLSVVIPTNRSDNDSRNLYA